MNLGCIRRTLPAANATEVGVVHRDGGIFHLFSDGGLLPVVRGGADDDDDDDDDEDDPGKGKGKPKTYTQAEVDRLTAREKDQGERLGMRKALEQLGVDPDKVKPEDLKATLEKARADEDAQKTEAQKAKDAADAAKADSDREKQAAAQERHQAAVERHLIRAGIGKDLDEDDDDYDAKLAKAISRASKLVEVEVGADPDKIAAAVTDLKKDMPALFASAAGGDDKQPDSDPAARTRKAKDRKVSGVARGKAKAAELGWVKEKQTA